METESTSTNPDDSLFDVASRKELKKVRFTPVQIARLEALYSTGTRGVGEAHLPSIAKTARDTDLDVAQVKVGENELFF